MILVKFKELKLLVDNNTDLDCFTERMGDMYTLYKTKRVLLKNMSLASKLDIHKAVRLQDSLMDFVSGSRVIGFPFDNHDAELYAVNRRIPYTVIELTEQRR